MAKKPKTILLMFEHRQADSHGKVDNVFVPVEPDGKTWKICKAEHGGNEPHMLYPRGSKVMRGTELANPKSGCVYRVAVGEEEGSIRPATAQCLGRIKDTNEVLRLQSIDFAERDAATTRARMSSELRRDLIEERLAPLRQAYRELRGAQRTVLIARVVRYISGT